MLLNLVVSDYCVDPMAHPDYAHRPRICYTSCARSDLKLLFVLLVRRHLLGEINVCRGVPGSGRGVRHRRNSFVPGRSDCRGLCGAALRRRSLSQLERSSLRRVSLGSTRRREVLEAREDVVVQELCLAKAQVNVSKSVLRSPLGANPVLVKVESDRSRFRKVGVALAYRFEHGMDEG